MGAVIWMPRRMSREDERIEEELMALYRELEKLRMPNTPGSYRSDGQKEDRGRVISVFRDFRGD
jgi:hypothetical protein